MNEATALLFDDFATSYRRGDAPDVLEYLARAGDDADVLAGLIDRFLQASPARPSTEEEIVLTRARLEQEPPLLVLRQRRRLTRDAVVGSLVRALKLDETKSAKVKTYFSDLEVGVLDPKPVDRRVWDALASILNANVRLLAGLRPPPPAAAAAFRREPTGMELRASLYSVAALSDQIAEPAAAAQKPEGPDEVDRLFTGMP